MTKPKPPPALTVAEFRDRIRAICGPAPTLATKPIVRKPTDRGYYPPAVDAQIQAALRGEKTIWNSDGTDGPCLICLPPRKGAA